jgi:hypothetical protein
VKIRHKVNKGTVTIDDATGEQLVESDTSLWERWAPLEAPEPIKPAPVKKAVSS